MPPLRRSGRGSDGPVEVRDTIAQSQYSATAACWSQGGIHHPMTTSSSHGQTTLSKALL